MNFQTRMRAGSFPTAVNTPSILTSVLISSWGRKEGGVLLRSSGFFFFLIFPLVWGQGGLKKEF